MIEVWVWGGRPCDSLRSLRAGLATAIPRGRGRPRHERDGRGGCLNLYARGAPHLAQKVEESSAAEAPHLGQDRPAWA